MTEDELKYLQIAIDKYRDIKSGPLAARLAYSVIVAAASPGNIMYLMDRLSAMTEKDTTIASLTAERDALEQMRPVWAQGFDSSGVAAQVTTAALTKLWKLLDAKDQTDAVQKLQALLPAQPPAKYVWMGEGPEPPSWTAPDGTLVYRDYESYVDD